MPNGKQFNLADTAKDLKSAQNILISRLNVQPIDFTTAAIRRNTGQEWAMVGIGARIVNNDTVNDCIVRLHNRNGTSRIVPPSTALVINEWFEEIHVEPDAITGSGQLQLEIVRPEDAVR